MIPFIRNVQNGSTPRARKQVDGGWGAGGVGTEWQELKGTGFFLSSELFWNETEAVVVHGVSIQKATELCALKWLVFCFVDFTSIF